MERREGRWKIVTNYQKKSDQVWLLSLKSFSFISLWAKVWLTDGIPSKKASQAVKVRIQGRGSGTGPGSFQMEEPGQTRLEERQAKQKAQVGWPKIPEEEGGTRSKARGGGWRGPKTKTKRTTTTESLSKHWVRSADKQVECHEPHVPTHSVVPVYFQWVSSWKYW